MTNYLLIVAIGLLVYMICERKKGEKEETAGISYREIIPKLSGKDCEITVKDPMFDIDVVYSMQGIILDVDDEWVMVEQREKKKKSVKVIRIENIEGMKEIVK